jgi:hypothetical protein
LLPRAPAITAVQVAWKSRRHEQDAHQR